jgi:ABC-2 type transport system ATP-binding protein
MRQRLGLAAALLGEPDVLILDEPANGLDPEGVHWLRRFLGSFADDGGTVLVSSHLLAEVAAGADDVVILAHGRLVTQSSLLDLARRGPTGVRARTPQPEQLRGALAAAGVDAELIAPDTVLARKATTETVGRAAAAAGLVIYEMSAQQFDLEDTFLALTATDGDIR